MGSANDDKRLFLIVSADKKRSQWMQEIIQKHVSKAVVFAAYDGLTGLTKFQNAPPHVLICDMDLPKLPGLRLIDQALTTKNAENTSIVVCGLPPEEEQHLDEIVTGRVQYCTLKGDEQEFNACVMKALNFAFHRKESEFHVRFLAEGEVLLREGEKADHVYFVKKGQLRAYKRIGGEDVVLGQIEYGEFVGEMAYINGEPRTANVSALSDCELIEVPIGTFDKVLFTRPSWSKALMLTLSKRVRAANQVKSS